MGAAILKIVHVLLRHAFSHPIIKPNLKVQSYFHYRYVIIIHNIDQVISNVVPKKKNYFYMRIKLVLCVVRHFRSKYFLKKASCKFHCIKCLTNLKMSSKVKKYIDECKGDPNNTELDLVDKGIPNLNIPGLRK